jgi:hypothetical protein
MNTRPVADAPSTSRVTRLLTQIAVGTLVLLSAAAAGAQTALPPTQGGFPEATFGVTFRKFTPPTNAFSPYDSWDAQMALDLTVARRGATAVKVTTVFETVGTENLGTRVSVGGTGYVIRAGFERTLSPKTTISVGVSHLSSHLTRDLDAVTAEQRALGIPVPVVVDPSEYNVVFLRAERRFTASRFTPVVGVTLAPFNFKFNGNHAAAARPLFIETRWTLWQRGSGLLAAETQHEIGPRAWNQVSLVLELYRRQQTSGRFQLFFSASPGHDLHVSPFVGGVRDGIAAGVRLKFESR